MRARHLNILRNRLEILIYQNITLLSPPLTSEKMLLNYTTVCKDINKPEVHWPKVSRY